MKKRGRTSHDWFLLAFLLIQGDEKVVRVFFILGVKLQNRLLNLNARHYKEKISL